MEDCLVIRRTKKRSRRKTEVLNKGVLIDVEVGRKTSWLGGSARRRTPEEVLDDGWFVGGKIMWCVGPEREVVWETGKIGVKIDWPENMFDQG